MAAAALVTEAPLAARGATWCSTRGPAPSSAGGRVMAAAVTDPPWEAVGVRSPTQPTPHRPGTCYQVAAGRVT
jgi:hypothetical protein